MEICKIGNRARSGFPREEERRFGVKRLMSFSNFWA